MRTRVARRGMRDDPLTALDLRISQPASLLVETEGVHV